MKIADRITLLKIDKNIDKLQNGILHAHKKSEVWIYGHFGERVFKYGDEAKIFYETSDSDAKLLIKILEHAKFTQNAKLAKKIDDLLGRHGYLEELTFGREMIYLNIPNSLREKIEGLAKKVDEFREQNQEQFNKGFDGLNI